MLSLFAPVLDNSTSFTSLLVRARTDMGIDDRCHDTKVSRECVRTTNSDVVKTTMIEFLWVNGQRGV